MSDPKTPRYQERFVVLAEVVQLAVLAGLTAYAASNDSGHTGFDPYLLFTLFAPLSLLGTIVWVRDSERRSNQLAGMIITGLLGMALIVILDQTNTLVEYERWLKRGMP